MKYLNLSTKEYFQNLPKTDRDRFQSLVEEKISSKNEDEYKQNQKDSLESEREHAALINAIASAFLPQERAGGYSSGFRYAITEPLQDWADKGIGIGDLVLVKQVTDPPEGDKLHILIIECKSGTGNNAASWMDDIKNIREAFGINRDIISQNQARNRRKLKQELDHEEKPIKSMQVGLACRAPAAAERDFDDLRDTKDIESPVLVLGHHKGWNSITRHHGYVKESELQRCLGSEIDCSVGFDIEFTIESHTQLQLEAMVEKIIKEQNKDSAPDPLEFNRGYLAEEYDSICNVGVDGEKRKHLVEKMVENIMDLGLTTEIFSTETNSNKEFRVIFSGKRPGRARTAARSKFMDSYPRKLLEEDAFNEAKEEFEPTRTLDSF